MLLPCDVPICELHIHYAALNAIDEMNRLMRHIHTLKWMIYVRSVYLSS